jgi:hypothetical protein
VHFIGYVWQSYDIAVNGKAANAVARANKLTTSLPMEGRQPGMHCSLKLPEIANSRKRKRKEAGGDKTRQDKDQ